MFIDCLIELAVEMPKWGNIFGAALASAAQWGARFSSVCQREFQMPNSNAPIYLTLLVDIYFELV